MTQQCQLNNTEIEVLESIFDFQKRSDRDIIQRDIVDQLGRDKSHISKILGKLDEKDLVKRKPEGRSKTITLTSKGCEQLLYSRSSTSEKYNNLLHLHKFVVKFPIQNLEELEKEREEDWREKAFRRKKDHTYNEKNCAWSISEKTYSYRVTRENILINIENLVGQDPTILKEKAINKAIKAAETIEKDLPIEITSSYKEVRAEVINQHLAIMSDPLSELVHETDYQGCDIKIVDEDGHVRLWTDDSDGRKDLEAGTQFGSHGFSEQDISIILKHYRDILRNNDGAN